MENTINMSLNDTNNTTSPVNITITSEEWTNREIILTIVLGIITLVTILGNSFVLYIFITAKRKLRSATHLLLANLAVADLLVGVMVMPVLASITILDFKFIWGGFICLSFDYGHFVLCAASMMSMVGVSIERYIGVRYPLKHKQIMTRNRTILAMVIIWILAGSITGIPLTLWPKLASGLQYVCYVNLRTELMYFVCIFIYFIPISLTIVTYYCIYRRATSSISYSSKMSMRKVDISKMLASTRKKQSTNAGDDSLIEAKSLKQIRLAKSIAMITGLMALFYAPIFALFALVAFQSPLFTLDLLIIFAWIRYCCSTINPFVYALAIPGYKQEIRERLFGVANNRKGKNVPEPSEITSYATTNAVDAPELQTLLKSSPAIVNVEKPKGKDQYCTQCGNLMRNVLNKNSCCDKCNRKVLCTSWILPTAWGTPCYFMCPECPSIRYFDGTQASFCQNCSHKFEPTEIKHSVLQRSTSGKYPSQNIHAENHTTTADRNTSMMQIALPTIATVDDKQLRCTTFGEEPQMRSKLQNVNSELQMKLNGVDSGQKAKVVKRLRESVIVPLMERRSRLITNRLTPMQNDEVVEQTAQDVDWIQELDEIVNQLQFTLDILDDQNSNNNEKNI